jgi:hypothetical protein
MVKSASSLQKRSSSRTLLFCAVLLGALSYLDPTLSLSTLAFICILLYLMYTFGMRDKWEGESEPSAYSVFNDNHMEIAGTFTGKQLDDQLRHRMPGDEDDGDVAARRGLKGLSTSNPGNGAAAIVADAERSSRRDAARLAAERRMQEASKSK